MSKQNKKYSKTLAERITISPEICHRKPCIRGLRYPLEIVLLNNQKDKDVEIPNANVNMEYGLLLGFNKYVIPFQRDDQKLPFNVAGLDTIKYSAKYFDLEHSFSRFSGLFK